MGWVSFTMIHLSGNHTRIHIRNIYHSKCCFLWLISVDSYWLSLIFVVNYMHTHWNGHETWKPPIWTGFGFWTPEAFSRQSWSKTCHSKLQYRWELMDLEWAPPGNVSSTSHQTGYMRKSSTQKRLVRGIPLCCIVPWRIKTSNSSKLAVFLQLRSHVSHEVTDPKWPNQEPRYQFLGILKCYILNIWGNFHTSPKIREI